MDAIAQTASADRDRSLGINAAGEVKGLGPAWACNSYSEPGHNNIFCKDCLANFMDREAA